MNFARYVPEEGTPEYDIHKNCNGLFLKDEDGNCWYEILKTLPSKLYKVAYLPNGTILQIETDATRMVPNGLSVAVFEEIGDAKPTTHAVVGGKIVKLAEDANPEAYRNKLMKSATAEINALVEAEDDGDITKEENVRLSALRSYRSKLRRLDLTSKFEWPTLE